MKHYSVTMVTVWRISLALSHELSEARLSCLDAHELRRASEFVDEADRNKWRMAHVALREILGTQLGIAARDVRFEREPNGRTLLAHHTMLKFSLSHAGELALVAVGAVTAIGVDVERERPVPGMEDVLRDVFTDWERSAMHALNQGALLDAFLRGWTRKEAVVKALGRGIEAMGLVEVTLGAKEAAIRALSVAPERTSDWSLHDLNLDLPYVGALAIQGDAQPYEMRDWAIS